ncbi:MAG TPA: hypothetical protein VHO25_24275 [Polyangiaceae bacterium]|nr:hypothetical protein [Polyangiaceae bacterium]
MRDDSLMSWTSFLQCENKDTPYLELFKELVALAYQMLGGVDVDSCLNSARDTHEAWRADKHYGATVARTPVPERTGVGSRREVVRYGFVKRKLYEDAASNVYRLFYNVLGYHAFDRREPWDRDGEPKPAEDAAKLEQIRIHAETLRVFLPAPHIPQRELPIEDVREGVIHNMQSRRDAVRIRELEQQVSNLIFENNKLQNAANPEAAAREQQQWHAGETETSGATHQQVHEFLLNLLDSDEPLTNLPQRESIALGEIRNWYKEATSHGLDMKQAQKAVIQMMSEHCRFNVIRDAAGRR